MKHSQPLGHPFALMMEPDSVVRAMDQSQLLARLPRKVCTPLSRLADDYTIDIGEDFGDADIDDLSTDLGLDFHAGSDDFY